jgi:hypothetical protein
MRHHRTHALAGSLGIIALFALLAGCASGGTASVTGTPTVTPLATATSTTAATSTPQPVCTVLVPSSAPYTSITGVPGMKLPTGAYVSSATPAGGGTGQYAISTYTVCFQGSEAQIDGVGGVPNSTIAQLSTAGWKINNLFPDPSNFSYLDYCSNAHNCLNDAGSPNPFTFVGFNQYASHPGGYTTFQLQVATISAPSCLNNSQYYSGTPKYTIYYDGNSASSSGNAVYHFQMPPGTRVSTFNGGGTAGSTYVYYCTAGSQSSVISFLKQALQNIGWAISNASASGFTAKTGSSPTYQIDVVVQNTNNYYLRVYVPM